jgi:hypothetical protein
LVVLQNLSQPINTGWTFGNLIISEQNSSAPDAERQIVSRDSYGRQIGKLLDALHTLIEAQGGARDVAAYQQIVKLWERVEQTKRKAAVRRIDQLQRDLQFLEATDKAAFNEKVKELRALLPESGRPETP